MKITVIEPHGFCAGVTAALRKAIGISRGSGAPSETVYCLHELVHNDIVVGDMKRRGFEFVESIEDVPVGATILFSAHGVPPAVRAAAERRSLSVIDATCPFVERVHRAAHDFAANRLQVVVIGNPRHIEVKGIVGEADGSIVVQSRADVDMLAARLPNPPPRIGVVSQTTMNSGEVAEIVALLKRRFYVETVAEVCNATKARQDAVRAFDGDALLVLGSASSSNTARLCECARCRSFRAGTIDELKTLDLSGISHLGVTSGASTPESFLEAAVAWLSGRM